MLIDCSGPELTTGRVAIAGKIHLGAVELAGTTAQVMFSIPAKPVVLIWPFCPSSWGGVVAGVKAIG